MRRHNPRVFRVTRSILGSDAEAEDASQDAFVRAFERLDQLAKPAAFGGWVTRIAANLALLRLRRDDRLRELIEEQETLRSSDGPAGSAPDRSVYEQQVRGLIEAALDQLPVPYRSVLVLRDVEDLSTEETAQLLGLNPATVRVRLHRARRLMRDRLERDLDVRGAELFAFDGERCDRLVGRVFRRLHDLRASWEPA